MTQPVLVGIIGDPIKDINWLGLISGLAHRYEDITMLIEFEDARMNFRSAARLGLAAEYVWLNGQSMPAVNLICDRLLPLAAVAIWASGTDDEA